MFNLKLTDIPKRLEDQKYIGTKEIHYAIFTALKLNKPLLIDGPPGVGKTELAKVLSSIFDAELIKLQCYEGIDSSKVIYDVNYAKQLLYLNILKETILGHLKGKESFEDAVKVIDEKTNFYGEDFLIERPLLKAMNPKRTQRKVLLIDELDKADYEIEAFLLEALSEFAITIPEYGTIAADKSNYPLIVLTSNNQREISEALRRRCVYLYIDYPDIKTESMIIQTKANVKKDFADAISNILAQIRNDLELRQFPSIAEAIEWSKILFCELEVEEVSQKFKEEIMYTLNTLIKNKKDLEKVRALLDRELS